MGDPPIPEPTIEDLQLRIQQLEEEKAQLLEENMLMQKAVHQLAVEVSKLQELLEVEE